MTDTVEVDVKSAWLSKINWGEVIKVGSMVAAALFGVDISPDTQVHILQAVIGIGALYTTITKTFFSSTITPASAANM